MAQWLQQAGTYFALLALFLLIAEDFLLIFNVVGHNMCCAYLQLSGLIKYTNEKESLLI